MGGYRPERKRKKLLLLLPCRQKRKISVAKIRTAGQRSFFLELTYYVGKFQNIVIAFILIITVNCNVEGGIALFDRRKTMSSTFSSLLTLFFAAILLTILKPSHQYVYSCNSGAACGCSSNPASVTRIVGGEPAASSSWGWAVSISISGTSLCGGAILSSSWIITAAHCMASVTSASQVTIYAGSNTRFSGQSRVASTITVHPNYVSSTKVNDIALIRLSTPLTMNSVVKTICIPSVSSATLTAGEWPPAGYYVCYLFFCSLFRITSHSLSIGRRYWMGHVVGEWFNVSISPTSDCSND